MVASHSEIINNDVTLFSKLLDYDHCFIGFSGGLDSTALLAACVKFLAQHDKPFVKLTAIHINHQINPASDNWQAHCETFCEDLGVPIVVKKITVDGGEKGLEADARKGRYLAFEELIVKAEGQSKLLLLGHHADDQAETLLLRLMRGTGLRGAACIPKSRSLNDTGIQLLRPLIAQPRSQLQQYVKDQNLSYLDDPSNQDLRFDRNFIRHTIIPPLLTRWPKAVELLNRFVDHLSADSLLLDDLAAIDLLSADLNKHLYGESLSLPACRLLSHRRRSNLFRYWFFNNHLSMPSTALMFEIDSFMITQSVGAQVKLSNFMLCIYRERLCLVNRDKLNLVEQCLKGRHDWALTKSLAAIDLSNLTALHCLSGQSLLVDGVYWVSNRRHCSKVRYQGINRSLKNVFQENGVPVWLRDSYPIVYSSDRIAAIPGLLVADDFVSSEGYQLNWSWQ